MHVLSNSEGDRNIQDMGQTSQQPSIISYYMDAHICVGLKFSSSDILTSFDGLRECLAYGRHIKGWIKSVRTWRQAPHSGNND